MKITKQHNRITNTIFNFTSSIGGQLITIIMKFIVRTVFINTLGKSYLGIGSLFSNILSLLSLVELGVGSAILYKLYDPIAKKDEHRIAILMNFYKSAYRIIGIVVALVGLCLIPFLPSLIKDIDKLENLGLNVVLVFSLYLFKTVSSYLFFAYRSAIIKANQKQYIITLIGYFFTVLTGVLQIVSLLIFPNFILYIAISFTDTIIKNICCAVVADRMYPFLKTKTTEQISKEERKGIFKDCGALFLYKMNGVVLKATDNIVLSAFLGLDMVAVYSNYYILYTTIQSLFAKVFNSVSHSLGNLHTTKNSKHEYEVFESVILISAVLGGTAFAGIFSCADELVNLWIGAEWVIPQPFSLLMGLEIYTLAFRASLSRYRSTMGLFQQAKFRPLAGMIINVILSVALVTKWGICGVLVGTIAADWLTCMWYDPLVVHKYGFCGKFPVANYYLKFGKYFGCVSIVSVLDYFICTHFLTGFGWCSFVVHTIICAVSVPAALIIISVNTQEGQYLLRTGKKYLEKVKKRICRKRRLGK